MHVNCTNETFVYESMLQIAPVEFCRRKYVKTANQNEVKGSMLAYIMSSKLIETAIIFKIL